MSTRSHMLNPATPALFSAAQEGANLAIASTGTDFGTHARDSVGDMRANVYGQATSIILWRSCKELCEGCQ